ncbi:vegetative cell wall protein gp1-like [Salvia splendens]|uniref:vegetative cell wall protein gp1-like n=1 Tax=Salvia splendens TaxID=180675 RepID=UPI001C25B1C5|nr:vegetative cell wall protein gp1-like [Salvia splendens]
MATQRPPWFRLPTMRPPAPAPAPAPAPTPTPRPPAIVRPAIPIRPPPPPQEPAPASQPPTAPPSPPAPPKPTSPVPTTTPSTPPRSPVAPRPSPLRAPVATSPPPPPPPSSPVTKPATVPTSSPQIKTQTTSPPSSKPTPPLPNAETANPKKATPLSSPKPLKPSQEIKASSHPPSPLQLPPALMRPSQEDREPKIEQKSVLVQESFEKPTKANNAHTLHSVPSKGKREPPPKDKGAIKKLSDSEDLGMRVITIAGENRGALMEINSSNKKKHPHGTAYTLANDTTSDHKDKNSVGQSQPPMETYLNSNVQGVNNSIVFNSSCHHNDPGIHLTLVRKLRGSRGNHHG